MQKIDNGYKVTSVCTINSKGLCISEEYNEGGNSRTITYKYDTNGYLIKLNAPQDADHVIISTFTIEKDNTIKWLKEYTGSTDYYFIYEHYLDKENTIGDQNKGISFWGTQDKNLLKSSTLYQPDGTISSVTTYTYEFDYKGRVAKQIEQDGYCAVYTYVE